MHVWGYNIIIVPRHPGLHTRKHAYCDHLLYRIVRACVHIVKNNNY